MLWQVSFIDPANNNVTPVPSSDIACPDLVPEIGITGTPVIDPATGTMYLVARTKENGNYIEKLHALDISTGAETLSGPVTIQASLAGSGEGSQNGVVSFNSYTQNQRAATTFSLGTVPVSQTGAPRSFGVNIVGTDATTFNSVAIGSNSTEYSVFSNGCTGSISGPATCTVKLSFSPTGGGRRTGTLNLSDSSGNQVVKLTAVGAAVQLAPTSLAFGIQNVGSTSAPQTVVVSVLGNTAAAFGTITVAGTNPADYAIQSDTCTGISVPGGSTCQFNMVFTPTPGRKPTSHAQHSQ